MNRLKTIAVVSVFVIALVAVAPAAVQDPIFRVVGFATAGSNDAVASIFWDEANSELEFQLTTSDTVEYTMDASTLWISSNTITLEGSTADASEASISAADVTADVVLQIQDDLADTYAILTQPDGDLTGGAFTFPAIGGTDVVTSSTDNVLLCQQVFLPGWLTVNNIMVRGVVATDSGTDDTLAVAIYADADAGTRLITSGASSDFTTTANATLAVTDTLIGPGFYRLCGCAQDVSGVAFHAATLDDESVDVMNQGVVTFGTGANSCAAGVPPTTTGALSTADDNIPVIKLSGG